MSDEGKPVIRLKDGQSDDDKLMYLVTIKTGFTIKNDEVITNKDQGQGEIMDVEKREIKLSGLEALGTECRTFNQRQEFYIKNDIQQMNEGKGTCNFMYISSRDPREKKETSEG